jgi:Regulator of Chromosome Condensation (RCC1) repeat protein
VNGVGGAVDLACGWDFNCCAVLGNGEARCWGANRFSQLTVSPTAVGYSCAFAMPCTEVPQIVRSSAGTAFGDIERIATGGETVLALKKDGTVWSWGGNIWGNLGNGTITFEPVGHMFPEPVGLPPSARLYASVATFLAVDRQGGLHTWGLNASGSAGLGPDAGDACGSPDAGQRCVSTPGRVASPGPIAQAEVKLSHGIALQTDGTVLVWGENGFGQLGHLPATDGDETCPAGPCQPTPKPMSGLP